MSEPEINFSIDPLESIKEIHEYSIESKESSEIPPEELILDLQEKIIFLEKENKALKNKVESITKKDALNNTIIMKMSMVGLRKKFTMKKDITQKKYDDVKVAEIIKEKEHLQEMNENMLDMLTEKEIENEDLNQKFENYKLEAKMQNEKDLEQITNLEKEIELLKNAKEISSYEEIDEEYKRHKEQLQQQINYYNKLETDLNKQIREKDDKIKKLNEEIQSLQFDNINLISKSEQQYKINKAGYQDLEKLAQENIKIKSKLDEISNDLDKKNKELKYIEENKNKEIEKYQEDIQILKKEIEKKNNDIKELDLAKTNLKSSNDQIYILLNNNKKELNEEKEKNYKIQEKLNKKTEELKSIKEYYKTLQTNNELEFKEYQEKIDELTKNKNDLISQNKDLLEKVKQNREERASSSGLSLDKFVESDESIMKDDIDFYINESKLLNEEINNLKEQISNQAHDLVEMNILEKNLEKIKIEKEDLISKNKQLSEQLNKLKIEFQELSEQQNKKDDEDESNKYKTMILTKKEIPELKRMQTLRSVLNLSIRKSQKFAKAEKDKNLLQQNYDRLKKLIEEEKKEHEKQIENIQIDFVNKKIRYLNDINDKDVLLAKYKNTFNSIIEQCKLKKIKLSVNLINK
jgi:hypothetical protein